MRNYQATELAQYANSPTIVQMLANWDAYLDPAADIDAFYNLVWNVDTAVGHGLDIWGRIVGVGRVLTLPDAVYFGFSGPGGPSGVPFNHGVFRRDTATTTNYALLDDPYRALILAKALFNISDGTIPAINQMIINLFGPAGILPVAGNSYVTDGQDMTMTYTFGSALTPVQKAIVFQSGVLPRPCGVSATVVQL